jgi:hypothetical protein
MVDIRKLVDPDERCISLNRLLLEAKKNCGLLTRKAIFAAEQIDYDPTARQRREEEQSEIQRKQGQSSGWLAVRRVSNKFDHVTSK